LLASHTVVRPDFIDSRSYTYANFSRRLTKEIVGLSATASWTNVFAYDYGVAGGPGVLTSDGQAAGTNVLWKGGTDVFSRINAATNSVAMRQAYGLLNGTATMTALLDGNPMAVTTVGSNDVYEWRAQLALQPGAHQLIVNALNWSGMFTACATNTFTNNAADSVQSSYAGNGEVTNRVWISSNGQTNAAQSLSWDARDRLHGITYLDSNTNGYIWSAIYDPLGRRMGTTTIFITNGVTVSNLPKMISQYFDPNVEFLELGETDSGVTTWKFYGPDVNGVYGGMQGVGGLEAVVNGPRSASPVINDIRGNALALYNLTQASLVWFPSRVTAYSAVEGYRPLPLADGAKIAQASAWRGKWADITGLYWIGNRYYDPVSGGWMSFDPVWNERDPNGFTFCGGEPIDFFDADGRGVDGTAINGYRSTVPFLTAQYSAWTVEETVDAVWNTAVATVATPDGMDPQNAINTWGNPLLRLGTYTPSSGNGQVQQFSGQFGQASQNLLYSLGTPVGQEPVDTTIFSALSTQTQFTHTDVENAIGSLAAQGYQTSEAQSSIDPNQVIRIAQAMQSGQFQNSLMDSPIIIDQSTQAILAGNHRIIAAQMTGFILNVNVVSVVVSPQPISSVPLQPGRVNPPILGPQQSQY
jgi:RHS repeat-associated protein